MLFLFVVLLASYVVADQLPDELAPNTTYELTQPLVVRSSRTVTGTASSLVKCSLNATATACIVLEGDGVALTLDSVRFATAPTRSTQLIPVVRVDCDNCRLELSRVEFTGPVTTVTVLSVVGSNVNVSLADSALTLPLDTQLLSGSELRLVVLRNVSLTCAHACANLTAQQVDILDSRLAASVLVGRANLLVVRSVVYGTNAAVVGVGALGRVTIGDVTATDNATLFVCTPPCGVGTSIDISNVTGAFPRLLAATGGAAVSLVNVTLTRFSAAPFPLVFCDGCASVTLTDWHISSATLGNLLSVVSAGVIDLGNVTLVNVTGSASSALFSVLDGKSLTLRDLALRNSASLPPVLESGAASSTIDGLTVRDVAAIAQTAAFFDMRGAAVVQRVVFTNVTGSVLFSIAPALGPHLFRDLSFRAVDCLHVVRGVTPVGVAAFVDVRLDSIAVCSSRLREAAFALGVADAVTGGAVHVSNVALLAVSCESEAIRISVNGAQVVVSDVELFDVRGSAAALAIRAAQHVSVARLTVQHVDAYALVIEDVASVNATAVVVAHVNCTRSALHFSGVRGLVLFTLSRVLNSTCTGIVIPSVARAEFSRSLFANNVGDRAGAMFFVGNANVSVEHCSFVRNRVLSAGFSAGAVYQDGSNVLLRNCSFEDNRSPSDAGALGSFAGSLVVEDSAFVGNFGAGRGGAVRVASSSSATFRRCLFRSNVALQGGGALSTDSASELTVIGCQLANNTVQRNDSEVLGSAISIHVGKLTLTNSSVVDNVSIGALGMYRLVGAVNFDGGTLVVDGSCVCNNTWISETNVRSPIGFTFVGSGFSGGSVETENTSLTMSPNFLPCPASGCPKRVPDRAATILPADATAKQTCDELKMTTTPPTTTPPTTTTMTTTTATNTTNAANASTASLLDVSASSDGGIGTEAIVGIVIGAVALVAFLAIVAFVVARRRKPAAGTSVASEVILPPPPAASVGGDYGIVPSAIFASSYEYGRPSPYERGSTVLSQEARYDKFAPQSAEVAKIHVGGGGDGGGGSGGGGVYASFQ
jgi:hypothetical protein